MTKPKPKAKSEKKKVAKPKPLSTACKLEHLEEIKAKERKVRTLQLEYESAKAEASSRKKSFEEADLGLRNMIARGPDFQAKLFPVADEPKKEESAKGPITRVRLMRPLAEGVLGKDLEIDVVNTDGVLTYAMIQGAEPITLAAGDYEAIGWGEPEHKSNGHAGNGEIAKAIDKLHDVVDGEKISSITLSSGGKSVTLHPKDRLKGGFAGKTRKTAKV